MDDIQNIIYFAVLIIWFLSRAFGGSKKKKQKQYPTPPINQSDEYGEVLDQPKSEPVTFEDILRELSGAPPKAQPAPEPEPQYYEQESNYEDVFGKPYEETEALDAPQEKKAIGHPDFVIEGGFKEFAITKKRGPKVARDVRRLLRQRNGLKQAIVLKEILDRKY